MMEGKRTCSDSATHVQSKKVKINNQIETSADKEIPNLPPEIIVEILTRLPVKSLLKFRLVSKSWLSFISSADFIKTHLKYSTNNASFTNHRIMLTPLNPRFDLKHCSLHSLMFEHATVASDIDYPGKSRHSSASMAGSCNGLICIAVDYIYFYIWNPSTRQSKKLPPAVVEKEDFYYICGFGYNDCDDDYKVVGIFFECGNAGVYESMAMIYSLKSNSWKRIEDFKGGTPLDDSGKFASGKLHFAATPGIDLDFRWNIASLDLKSEVYGMVEQPNYGEGCSDFSLGVLGGCICVLSYYRNTRADVWVLKEYDVKESWTKVVSIPYIGDPGNFLYSNPLLMMPNGEILLIFGMRFVVYNPRDNSFRCPEASNVAYLGADISVESLVSLQVED